MSDAFCKCPRCHSQFEVELGGGKFDIACINDDYGGVVTDSDLLCATKIVYLRHVRCPHCGALLHVFITNREVSDGTD